MNKKRFSPTILLLDIETSRIIGDDKQQHMIPYLIGVGETNYRKIKEGDNSIDYHPFRTNIQVMEYLEKINNETSDNILCYIHNLSYEFSWLKTSYYEFYKNKNWFEYDEKGILETSSFMGDSPRKPFKMVFKNLPKIEFRCSYKLTNKSIATIGENVGLPKLDKQDGYKSTYTPYSLLPKEEYEYNYRDLELIVMGIHHLIFQGDGYQPRNSTELSSIYSSTSYIKKCMNKLLGKNAWYMALKYVKLKPRTIEQYSLIDKAYVGGWTHSNYLYNGMTLYKVHSIDLTSAYPSEMVSRKYPTRIYDATWEKYIRIARVEKVGFIAKFRFTNIKSKIDMSYIPSSKCTSIAKGTVLNNGKIFKSDEIEIIINDVQFALIKEMYDIESIEVDNNNFLLLTHWEYLPKYYTDAIYKYANIKTELKEVLSNMKETDKDYAYINNEYMKSKNILNGIYGTHGMRYLRPQITKEGKQLKPDISDFDEKMESIRRKYFDMIIASYITTYTHETLFKGMKEVMSNGGTILYCDTDSIKFHYDGDVKELVEKINAKISPLNEIGKMFNKDFGFCSFDYEKTYTRFKYLGAKKYTWEHDGYIGVTVAGVPKRFSEFLNKNEKLKKIWFETFDEGYTFKQENTNKLSANYSHELEAFTYQSHVYHDMVHLENIDYKLSNSLKIDLSESEENDYDI